jgi:hypothetical protein
MSWHGVHICNPSYSGGGDQEDHTLRSGQNVYETPSNSMKKLGMMVCICHSSYAGSITMRTAVQTGYK